MPETMAKRVTLSHDDVILQRDQYAGKLRTCTAVWYLLNCPSLYGHAVKTDMRNINDFGTQTHTHTHTHTHRSDFSIGFIRTLKT